MTRTLIVIDLQHDFIDGPLGTHEAQAIVPNVKKKIEEYKSRGDAVIFTRDTHYGKAKDIFNENEDTSYFETNEGKHLPIKHCIYGSYGWRIPDELAFAEAQYIDKMSFGYDGWDFCDLEQIEIVGLVTDICVISNALIIKSLFPEADITVDASCCAGTTPEKHKAAIDVMKSCQIDIIGG